MSVGAPANSRRGADGAAVLEFAVILPLLLLLLLGIVESAWAFNQQLEIRHGAREGARLAAVNSGTDAQIAGDVCDRMHFSGEADLAEITISRTGDSIGDVATVVVTAPYKGLTGFMDGVFGGSTFSNTVDMRFEQAPQANLGTAVTHACGDV